jgi:hypothetical protein
MDRLNRSEVFDQLGFVPACQSTTKFFPFKETIDSISRKIVQREHGSFVLLGRTDNLDKEECRVLLCSRNHAKLTGSYLSFPDISISINLQLR